VTLVAYAVPFALLATLRARQGGPLPRDLRCVIGGAFYAMCVLGFAATATETPRVALGFAFLFVCAWSDLTARKVYLPVTVAAIVAAAFQAAWAGQLADAVAGGLALSAAAAIPYGLTRGRGFGLGDVLLAAVIGAAFGLDDGALVFAYGFIVGAIISSVLLAARVIGHRDPLPLVTFVTVGSLVLVGTRAVGWTLG
jgi:prepilin signal peptidase PulO-like enzyme (type II secretory pathway)